ncbi:uncharacterized protein LOC122042546 isoform X2 [Zingiber officinale]|uniref:uncharacterized protein LOC122042546 isoform X2 n=1 Tax=Zingiber officinale TaxID=94328 RepID=UPI001C4D12AE|nr:uncharacterized protein LOC122042546 isoform X2 [Zingiber officinale]
MEEDVRDSRPGEAGKIYGHLEAVIEIDRKETHKGNALDCKGREVMLKCEEKGSQKEAIWQFYQLIWNLFNAECIIFPIYVSLLVLGIPVKRSCGDHAQIGSHCIISSSKPVQYYTVG